MDVLKTQGIEIPRLGFGTFRLTGAACREAVELAIELGYRHIDTAEMYENEEAVGEAIAASGIARSDFFVTTKVWHEHLEPASLRRSLDGSLAKLKLDAVDLYLIHWPAPGMDMAATFGTLMSLREEGLVRAIGVCNFPTDLLKAAVEEIGAPIACHQLEYHVYLDQSAIRRYLAPKRIPIVAYAPLAHATVEDDPAMQKIGEKHGATASQIALAWLLDQDDVAAIPKATSRAHQQANLDALKIHLDDEDRRIIATLPKDQRRIDPPWAPRWDLPAA